MKRQTKHMRIVMALLVAVSTALIGILAGSTEQLALGEQTDIKEVQALRAGKNFIATPVYNLEDDQRTLKLFEGLRVADVSDGMDKVGLANVGFVDPGIHASWKDTQHYTHRFIGVAVTVRYVPTNKPPAPALETEAFNRWVGQSYTQWTPEPFVPLLRPGSALVIDDADRADVGSIGSNNIMAWKLRGCVGVVTDATARDTDEIATERMPLYYRHPGRGIRPGRNEIESVNRPVACGGVLVRPGDIVVADGDGVIIVPREKAAEVAAYARLVIEEGDVRPTELLKTEGVL